MSQIGSEYPINFRQELVAPLFQAIRAGESTAVIGVASMGKTRLIQFLLRPDVHQHYLQTGADPMPNPRAKSPYLFVWVDCNRLAQLSTWGLYELILTSIVESVTESELRNLINPLRQQTILSDNMLLAQRYVELVIHMLCQERKIKVCLMFDEFDELYRNLPAQTLSNLRALRDANKYDLTYLLWLRDPPNQLRSHDECEHFYELFSRNELGLTPHTPSDTLRVIDTIAKRRQHELGELSETQRQQLLTLSGGHPGFLVALIDSLVKASDHQKEAPTLTVEWAVTEPSLMEECRKIWRGLPQPERAVLHYLVRNVATKLHDRQSLLLKGLICQQSAHQFTIFSPILAHFAARQSDDSRQALHIDLASGAVWLNGRLCPELTYQEFKLLSHLYEQKGKICDHTQLIAHLYPGEQSVNVEDNVIAVVVRRIRQKIEPDPRHPQYLLNVQGRGYRLEVGASS